MVTHVEQGTRPATELSPRRGENPYIARMMAGTFKLPGKIEDPLQRDG